MKLPELKTLLTYKNLPVLKLYQQNYPNHTLSAEEAFTEVLKYLWLTQKHAIELNADPSNEALPTRCAMLRSMQEIDDMWHEFILFTQDYTDFCEHYFGRYLHHLPNIFDTQPKTPEEGDAEIEKLLPYVYNHLGEETLRVWYRLYL